MKTITLIFMFLGCVVVLFALTGTYSNYLIDSDRMEQKVGNIYIVQNDTFKIVNYSAVSKTFTLEDEQEVSEELINQLK
ncbi:MAG: hypothetical protein QNK20_16620 [Aureibaculum sp.]|nr:hypothetical protein [Aureibaculum sp.]